MPINNSFPEKLTDLSADILKALQSAAKESQQAKQDQKQLEKYLKTKRADACESKK